MDKNAIKKYAVWARTELIARVTQKALQYGIEKDKSVDATADSVHGKVLTAAEKKQRQALIAQIRAKGFEQVMEEVGYTWFNRFSALRFMEVNGYLPSHVRVFTDEENNFKPQIITEAIHLELDGLDMEKVYAYKEADKIEELFKYLLIVQCNALNDILPGMFQKIEDYTELLLPDNLLREGSIIHQMIELIPESDWTDQIQVIGWLYQYYNTEQNELVYDGTLQKAKLPKELVPAATVIYTPDWAVRYMVENSLGKMWLLGHPESSLQENWKYYLEDATQPDAIQERLLSLKSEYGTITPEEIRCIDPCMGSGHILTYMFDVLMQIYESCGYTTRDAVANIVEKNLWGLDIDDRATQLSYFSVMMKARQYDRRFFSRKIQPNVYAITESNNVNSDSIEYFADGNSQLRKEIECVISALHDAKEFGSLIRVDNVDFDRLFARFEEIKEDIHIFSYSALNELYPLVNVAFTLAQKYHTVVTNPPYLSNGRMNDKLAKYVNAYYSDVKYDLSSAMYERAIEGFCLPHYFTAFITTKSWMFLSNFESFRKAHLEQYAFSSILDLGTELFDGKVGHNHIVSWVAVNDCLKIKGTGIKLSQFCYSRKSEKESQFFNPQNTYFFEQEKFGKIPGNPIAYWVSDSFVDAFKYGTLGTRYETKKGMFTGKNDLFLRFWYEVDTTLIGTDYRMYNKGGGYRRWYGNGIYVIRWKNNGEEVKNFKGSGNINEAFYYKRCLTWNLVTLAPFCCRFLPEGYVMGDAGPTCYVDDENMYYLLAYMNTSVANLFMSVLNPTMNYPTGVIDRLPVVVSEDHFSDVDRIAKENLDLSRQDWATYETSMEFARHFLVQDCTRLSDAMAQWEMSVNNRRSQMKTNEEYLNRLFMDIYNFHEDVEENVLEKDLSVRSVDIAQDIKSFISYAVGCMFGRYSLDAPGLVYAGGEWDASKYATFPADKDSIIPICDDEYFEDDIVGRFIKFIEVVYGKDTLNENLKFIADALGGKGNPKDVIRSYFLNDFYNDHVKMYQKRPIYWQFDSGKKNGFKCLIYMHRYQPDTIARIRTDYVHEQQARYRTAIAVLEQRISNASAGERVKLSKKLKTLQEQATEIHGYEEKIHHLADQMIRIDLDDGVKKNYEIFKDVLAKIK